MGALARTDGAAILGRSHAKWPSTMRRVKDGWNGFNVLHTAAGRVGGLDVGFVPGARRQRPRGILDAAGKRRH